MYFGIFGEDEVDNIVLKGDKSILIRICKNIDLKTSYLYEGILCLDIDDIVSFEHLTVDFELKLRDAFISLNQIILRNDFDEVIIHCALGISRSPAIMICVSIILGSIEMEQIVRDNFFNYNRIIVTEFEKFNYIKKEVNIANVVFLGHFINRYDDGVIECNDMKENRYSLILKK